jgi:thioredoxin-like negative regulator of GroEL
MKEELVLEWLIRQKHEDTIEEVTEEMLEQLIRNNNLVLVLFAPNDCKDCARILADLETIDDDTDEHGILFVTTDDLALAKSRFKIKKFPSLVLIQNEHEFDVYDGDDLSDEQKVLDWVTSQDLLDKSDEIEPVSEKGFEKLLERSDFVVALFSKKSRCRLCDQVKEELEKVDHLVEAEDIDFVLIDDPDVAEQYSIDQFPTLVFFNKRFPQFFDGPDLLDEDQVLEWIRRQRHSSIGTDQIELIEGEMLRNLLDDLPAIAVFFYDQTVGCGQFTVESSSSHASNLCESMLRTLEDIDDDAYSMGVHFVRSGDVSFAAELHVHRLPALVYFEHGLANVYAGPTDDSANVLAWLKKQRTEDTIEEISREMLFALAAQHEYLAVVFYKPDDDESDEVLEHLERIDDDCSEFDVQLVKLRDQLIAKKYGVRHVPALVLFRRQQPLRYDGNLFDEDAVLEWLTRVDTTDSHDAVERVNRRMFERLLSNVPHLAVFLYTSQDCKPCERLMSELERIDRQADSAGVRLVKVDDSGLATRYGVHALPALLFFKHGTSRLTLKSISHAKRILNRFDANSPTQVNKNIRLFLPVTSNVRTRSWIG